MRPLWVLISLVGLAATALFACGGDDDEPPATATASPTTPATTAPATASSTSATVASPTTTTAPDPSRCPVHATTCSLAQRVLMLLDAGNIDGLVAMGSPISASCPVPRPSGLGGPYPLCDDATTDGEMRSGYIWGCGSHGGLDDEDRLRSDLQRLVTSGAELLTIGCATAAGAAECEGDFSLVFGVPGDRRLATELIIRHGDPAARDGILGVLPILVPECASVDTGCERVEGGQVEYPQFRHWGTLEEGGHPPLPGRYFPWTP